MVCLDDRGGRFGLRSRGRLNHGFWLRLNSSINMWSSENAGTLDFNAELALQTRAGNIMTALPVLGRSSDGDDRACSRVTDKRF